MQEVDLTIRRVLAAEGSVIGDLPQLEGKDYIEM